ncbi:MAG: 16S rRNA (cytosine(1402)-N(4))-methyltransferase RsmH [Actinomycetia bacterium]|nr:16S rRNA (cytosine(1402)-N(4))-methyltransferase RsmH [Actinomycetes bacterium]
MTSASRPGPDRPATEQSKPLVGNGDPAPEGAPNFFHQPVMIDEIVETFGSVPSGWVVDATVGGAGHSAALLGAHPHLSVLGIDRDPRAVESARSRLQSFGPRAEVRHTRFDGLDATLDELGVDEIVGFLFDLGVSSPQLDEGERGFSYRHDGPLDMRMDPDSGPTAGDVVNDYPERDLARLLTQYGDERFAVRVARAIVLARPVHGTAELAELVRSAIPAAARRRGGHPAKRSFQAIRIEVNQELQVLGPALDQALGRLAPGGRGAVLTYHSGEDRIVKQRFRAVTGGDRPPPPRGLPVETEPAPFSLVRPATRTPSETELEANRRAASARLRVIERVDSGPPGAGS